MCFIIISLSLLFKVFLVNAYAFIVIIYYVLYVQKYLLCSLSFLISAESSHSVLKIHHEHW